MMDVDIDPLLMLESSTAFPPWDDVGDNGHLIE